MITEDFEMLMGMASTMICYNSLNIDLYCGFLTVGTLGVSYVFVFKLLIFCKGCSVNQTLARLDSIHQLPRESCGHRRLQRQGRG